MPREKVCEKQAMKKEIAKFDAVYGRSVEKLKKQ